MTHAEVKVIARGFWRLAGSPPPFPRDLERAVLWALPLAVVKIPRLRVTLVRDWLSADGLADIIPRQERPLRACILASRGRGLIFVDGADAADEQRMSLAHEVAHFLVDYLLPRERAVRALGPSILSVLDGDRAATPAERLSAVLRGVNFGVYSRLWLRGPRGLAADSDVVAKEDMADILALELLAPRGEVIVHARRGLREMTPDAVAELLRRDFGLPASAASAYAGTVCVSARPSNSVRSWLGLADSRGPSQLPGRRGRS